MASLTNRLDMFDALIARAQLDNKSFQYNGLKWCLERELGDLSTKGGIIADEMGLGKTILMIGLIYSHFVKRTLIVLPVALIKQWQQTILQLTGHKALVYYGKGRKNITKDTLHSAPIVLTTYNIVTIDACDKQSLLHTIRWGRIIYDEGHHLRNSATIRHIGCKALTSNITWVVSGTPIQNKAKDLFSSQTHENTGRNCFASA
jgi:DNA repair protein RAD16